MDPVLMIGNEKFQNTTYLPLKINNPITLTDKKIYFFRKFRNFKSFFQFQEKNSLIMKHNTRKLRFLEKGSKILNTSAPSNFSKDIQDYLDSPEDTKNFHDQTPSEEGLAEILKILLYNVNSSIFTNELVERAIALNETMKFADSITWDNVKEKIKEIPGGISPSITKIFTEIDSLQSLITRTQQQEEHLEDSSDILNMRLDAMDKVIKTYKLYNKPSPALEKFLHKRETLAKAKTLQKSAEQFYTIAELSKRAFEESDTDLTRKYNEKSVNFSRVVYNLSSTVDIMKIVFRCFENGQSRMRLVMYPYNYYNPFNPVDILVIKIRIDFLKRCVRPNQHPTLLLGTVAEDPNIYSKGKYSANFDELNPTYEVSGESDSFIFYASLGKSRMTRQVVYHPKVISQNTTRLNATLEPIENEEVVLSSRKALPFQINFDCKYFGRTMVTIILPMDFLTPYLFARFSFIKYCGRADVTPSMKVYNSSFLNYSVDLLNSGLPKEKLNALPFELKDSIFEVTIPKHRNLTIPITVSTVENTSYYGYNFIDFYPNSTIDPIQPGEKRYFTIWHKCKYDGNINGNITILINEQKEYVLPFEYNCLIVSFTKEVLRKSAIGTIIMMIIFAASVFIYEKYFRKPKASSQQRIASPTNLLYRIFMTYRDYRKRNPQSSESLTISDKEASDSGDYVEEEEGDSLQNSQSENENSSDKNQEGYSDERSDSYSEEEESN